MFKMSSSDAVTLLFFWALVFPGELLRGETFVCSWQPNGANPCAFNWTPQAKTKDTTYGVALYACSQGDSDPLPSWWRTLWNPSLHPSQSIATYFKDMSRGLYHLAITPFGRDTLHRIVSNKPPRDSTGSTDAFVRDVLGIADTIVGINFASFDNDGPNHIPASQDACSSDSCMADGKKGDDDGYVDAVFILDLGMGVTGSQLGMLNDYETKDTGAHGQRIKVSDQKGVSRSGDFSNGYHGVICHEWLHVLGLPDLYGVWTPGTSQKLNWSRLGSFSIMSSELPFNIGHRPNPLDPFSQIKLGWVKPDSIVEVTSPFFLKSVPNFVTSGKIYKIKRSETEYFLVTNHQGVDPEQNPAGYYEGNFTGYGLLIWHIDETGCHFDRDHKMIDIELAHGLYDFTGDTLGLGAPNPKTGKDSLDFHTKPNGATFPGPGPGRGQSFTCFWNPANNNKIHFDGLSNPTSDGYRDSVIDFIRLQDIPTHLAVRNISATQLQSATADLLINNWYGHITQNTTWGPNKAYAVTGDITVDSAETLTIAAGTTVYLQSNQDNQSAGADAGKCEIIVKPGGCLIVGCSAPPKSAQVCGLFLTSNSHRIPPGISSPGRRAGRFGCSLRSIPASSGPPLPGSPTLLGKRSPA